MSQVRGLGLPTDSLKCSMACNLELLVYQGEFGEEYKMTGYLCNKQKKESHVQQPGASDFAIGSVIFILNFPNGQLLFFGEIQITEGL